MAKWQNVSSFCLCTHLVSTVGSRSGSKRFQMHSCILIFTVIYKNIYHHFIQIDFDIAQNRIIPG